LKKTFFVVILGLTYDEVIQRLENLPRPVVIHFAQVLEGRPPLASGSFESDEGGAISDIAQEAAKSTAVEPAAVAAADAEAEVDTPPVVVDDAGVNENLS